MNNLRFLSTILIVIVFVTSNFAQENKNQEKNTEEKIDTEATQQLPPPAVKISDIPAYNNNYRNNPLVKKVSHTTKKTIENKDNEEDAVVEPDFVAPNLTNLNAKSVVKNELKLSDAYRVATNELFPAMTNVYFIQLASLSRSSGNANIFGDLTTYGNIYKIKKSGNTKIKLGYFYDRNEAERILSAVKNKGYTDAFLTEDILNTTELELVLSSYDTPSSTTSTSSQYGENSYTTSVTNTVKYKVRLASYEDPIWFDIENARTLGTIEQWTKGDWTIFVLSEYSSMDSAQAARSRAIAKGFSDAEVVIDNNGVLERIR